MRLLGLACSTTAVRSATRAGALGAAFGFGVAVGGCSDDGLTPEAAASAAGSSSGGAQATSSVTTSASGSDDMADKLDVPPVDPGTTGDDTVGVDGSDTGFGTTGPDTETGDDAATTTGAPPGHPCIAGEECTCDPGAVFCEALPPMCPAGEVPLVDENTQCWEGSCVPLEACYTVVDCSWCEPDEACVSAADLSGLHYTCQPIDPACVGMAPTCDCMPMACDMPFFECVPPGPGADEDLACVCPAC